MVFVGYGEMVEGARCEIYARLVNWKGLREDPITGKCMTVYELDRNCSVKVTEPLKMDERQKELRLSKGVHFNTGDKIEGDAITVYVDSNRKVRFLVKEGMTSTHGGMFHSSDRRTIGRIKYPFPNLVKVLSENYLLL